MKILINYADSKYKKTQKLNTFTGINIGGFDKVYSFGPEDIDQEFINNNKYIFNNRRGNGLWLWKPYFIDKVMSQANEGDIIFYCDSGSFFYRNVKDVIKILENGEKILVSDIPLIESCFTKPSCFEIMKCDYNKLKNTNQIIATYFIAICCDETKRFVKEWLKLCQDVRLISPEKNENRNDKDISSFFEHREDQSILSLLCKKYGIKPHRDLSHRGIYPETYYNPLYTFSLTNHKDKYKPVLYLHKLEKINFINLFKQILKLNIKKREYSKIKNKIL